MKKVTKTREELYEMVWKEPLTSISKRLNIPYNELRKIYHNMEIPIPAGGYWSKLRWGVTPEITELPVGYSGENQVELIERESGDPTPVPCKTEDKEEWIADPQFKVPARITNPDILTTRAKEFFDAHKEGFWGSNLRFLEGKNILSIDVPHKNLPRALRIFDTIIKILKSRGHEISFNWDGTVAVIYGQEIGMRLREINKVSDKPRERYSSRELVPTGRFTFLIGRHYDNAVNVYILIEKYTTFSLKSIPLIKSNQLLWQRPSNKKQDDKYGYETRDYEALFTGRRQRAKNCT